MCYTLVSMNSTTIADIQELKKGSPVLKMNVQVKKGFEPGEGETHGRPWKMQAAILTDENGDEIRTTFWNRFNLDLRNLEGEDIILIAEEDNKGKIGGITVDEYKGKKQLKVEKHVKIDQVTGGNPDGTPTETLEAEINRKEREADEHDSTSQVTEPDMSGSSVANNGAPSSEYKSSGRFVSEETKRESIERQVALKSATELSAAAGVLDVKEILKMAEKMYQFLHGSA